MSQPIVYPKGHPIAWNKQRCAPRKGEQDGVLARPWTEHTIAWVIWNGETTEYQELPECIEPGSHPTEQPVHIDLWSEHSKEERAKPQHETARQPGLWEEIPA